jgi:beta-galactosidase
VFLKKCFNEEINTHDPMKHKKTICFTSKTVLMLLLTLGIFGMTSAQKTYTIDVTGAKKDITRGYLDLGGKSITGESIEVNSFYIERNSRPYFPVMGEFHYCRYPSQYWDEEIKKMKAGGINVIATYVFWILHENKEGVFNWENDLNLRKFIEICQKNQVEAIVRIGPFAHGEMRNGGLPDWLYGRPFEVRSNDPDYLFYADRFYNQIAQQLKGLYFKDGGPIIGIQIENEYQHSAAPWSLTYLGSEKEFTAARFDRKIIQAGVGVNDMGNDHAAYGQKHMQTLKEMAKKAGMDVPIYTATGWGFASIVEKGSIPVMAGYAYPTWVASDVPSNFYCYKDLRKFPDYSPVSYNTDLYPSLAAELGTGMCVTYAKRPRVPAESFLPMMVRTLGSGTNGLGYYMYHGGTTPSDGNLFFTEGFGYHNKSYDYQAPVGEFGNPSRGFYSLKLVNYFLQHFGTLLAPLPTLLPETNSLITPDDTLTLRYAIRSDGYKGFVFMHNFQDHVKINDLNNLQIKIKTSGGIISIPETGTFTLKQGTSLILPFNLDLNGMLIKYATVQPLCSYANAGNIYHVFWSVDGITPEIVFKGSVRVKTDGAYASQRSGNTVVSGITGKTFECIVNQAGKTVHILVIPIEKALQSYLAGSKGNQHLVISEATVLEDKEVVNLINIGKEEWKMEVYPQVNSIQAVNAKLQLLNSEHRNIAAWSISVTKNIPVVTLTRTDDRHIVLNAKNLDLTNLNDVFVKFDYRGDRALCFLNGELKTDNLYIGEPWLIGLKRFATRLQTGDMYFYFIPMRKDAPYLSYFDKEIMPDFATGNDFLEINDPEIIPEYKVTLMFK